jgi:dTDP-glucose 4,6-dehydratase
MAQNKKIFLTGSLGVIGKPLWQELKNRGYDVFGCDLYHSHDPKYFRCDIGKYRQLEKIFEAQKFDYVYNLAAEFGRWNGEDFYENLWTTNVIGLKNIIRLQEKYKFKLVHFSSSEVYGDYDGVMQEDVMNKVEIKQLNDYAITKWVNELQILNSTSQSQIETLRVRIFNIYGPGEIYSLYRSALCRFVYCALNKMPFTVYKGHTRSWLFIDDACKTLANIVENFKAGGVYNIANPESLTIEKLAEVVLEKTGAEKDLAIYKESEPFTTKFKKVDISKAKRDLNHNPQTSIEIGVEKTVNWMKEFYKI